MTLITYPTRVHFADGVLEEALHSELERAQSRSALLICHQEMAEHELADRVLNGVPARVAAHHMSFSGMSLRDKAREIASDAIAFDVILAFGSAEAIELGRKIRFARDQKTGNRPRLFAVPAVDGLPDPCNRNVESKQAGLPSVVICDPTVNLGADQEESLRATVMSLIRCIESYLSSDFNPPADGMALDGLSRCLSSLAMIARNSGLEFHRDVMASCLNAFLSQEKGVGPAQTMTSRLLADVSPRHRPDVARLVLPGVLDARSMDDSKADVLKKVLSVREEPLSDATRRILSKVRMPDTLADLGVPREALDLAARAVEGNAGLTFQNARTVLENVYAEV